MIKRSWVQSPQTYKHDLGTKCPLKGTNIIVQDRPVCCKYENRLSNGTTALIVNDSNATTIGKVLCKIIPRRLLNTNY